MMLNNIPRGILRSKDPGAYHRISETFRKALLYRMQRPFDPATYHQAGDRRFSRGLARRLSRSIRDTIDPSLPLREPSVDLEDTTHLSVMDDEGNAVSMTQSIEMVYGSKAAARGLGFLYNNYISAFHLENPSHPFFLRPNAVPWSSVCPSIVFYNHRPWITVGSPGSSRILLGGKPVPIQGARRAEIHPRVHGGAAHPLLAGRQNKHRGRRLDGGGGSAPQGEGIRGGRPGEALVLSGGHTRRAEAADRGRVPGDSRGKARRHRRRHVMERLPFFSPCRTAEPGGPPSSARARTYPTRTCSMTGIRLPATYTASAGWCAARPWHALRVRSWDVNRAPHDVPPGNPDGDGQKHYLQRGCPYTRKAWSRAARS